MAAGGAAAAPSAGGSAGPSAAGISDLGASSALAASSGALPRRAREGWGAGGACTAASGRVTRVSGGRACLGVAGATVTKTARACVSCAGRRLVFGRRLCVDMSEGCAASVGLGAHALWRRAGHTLVRGRLALLHVSRRFKAVSLSETDTGPDPVAPRTRWRQTAAPPARGRRPGGRETRRCHTNGASVAQHAPRHSDSASSREAGPRARARAQLPGEGR